MSTEQAADEPPDRYVLFVCNHNADPTGETP